MPKFGDIHYKHQDLKDLKWTISVVKQVGETHFGLGHRVAFLLGITLAEMGVLQIGTMGIGKTKSLEAIELITRKGAPWTVTTQEFTLAGINKKINATFSNNRVVWISKDLAKLSPVVQENMLKVACALISDHECRISTSMYKSDIVESTISWLGACTYEVFNILMGSPLWRGMYQDRILRYHAFQLRTRGINTSKPNALYKFNLRRKVEVEEDRWFKRVVDLFESQFTYERSVEYTHNILAGMAKMNHRRKAVPADAKFILMHKLPISAEAHIAWRETISSPLYIDTDALLLLSEAVKRDGVSVSFLANKYHTDEDSVLETAKEATDLVKIRDGGNTIRPSKFVLQNVLGLNKFEDFCVEKGERYYAP